MISIPSVGKSDLVQVEFDFIITHNVIDYEEI